MSAKAVELVEKFWELMMTNDFRSVGSSLSDDTVGTTLDAYIGTATVSSSTGDVVIEALSRYAAAGVTDLCVRFVGDDQQAQLERFTAEVLPALRA